MDARPGHGGYLGAISVAVGFHHPSGFGGQSFQNVINVSARGQIVTPVFSEASKNFSSDGSSLPLP